MANVSSGYQIRKNGKTVAFCVNVMAVAATLAKNPPELNITEDDNLEVVLFNGETEMTVWDGQACTAGDFYGRFGLR